MTVDATKVYNVYTVTRDSEGEVYPITFPFISAEYVKCYFAVGKEQTVLEYGLDYTVNEKTSELTVLRSLPVDSQFVVFRVTDLTQEIDWVEGQAVYTPDIEQADDKAMHILQELAEQTNRSVKITREAEAEGVHPEDRWEEIEEAREQVLAAKDETVNAVHRAEQVLEQIPSARDEALNKIRDSKTEALESIATNKQAAIDAITGKQTEATNAIDERREQTLHDIANAKTDAMGTIGGNVEAVLKAREEAQEASNEARDYAQIAINKAGQIQNLTVEAETLTYPNACTAEYNPVSGRLFLGITEGKPGKDGADGLHGQDGLNGRDGKDALPPAHIWDGTRLAFQNPDGTWGKSVDLRGEVGPQGQSPVIDVIDCGGACGFKLAQIDAGMACSFAN